MKEIISTLINMPDEAYGKFAFSYDILCNKVSEEEKEELIKKADECGCYYADRLMAECASESTGEIAEKAAEALGLTVCYEDSMKGGDGFVFAQFERPDKITIYSEPLRAAGCAVRESDLVPLPGDISVTQVILAHEIFHYLEEKYEHEIFTRQHKITLWAPGPFRNRSTIRCLGEIAAMAFAKRLCGLKYSPFIVDVLVAYTLDQKIGEGLYLELLKYGDIAG